MDGNVGLGGRDNGCCMVERVSSASPGSHTGTRCTVHAFSHLVRTLSSLCGSGEGAARCTASDAPNADRDEAWFVLWVLFRFRAPSAAHPSHVFAAPRLPSLPSHSRPRAHPQTPRFWRISFPAGVVFDESHFGYFTGHYQRHSYVFDIHPPLGKLTVRWLTPSRRLRRMLINPLTSPGVVVACSLVHLGSVRRPVV
jgi:hypothetical protein